MKIISKFRTLYLVRQAGITLFFLVLGILILNAVLFDDDLEWNNETFGYLFGSICIAFYTIYKTLFEDLRRITVDEYGTTIQYLVNRQTEYYPHEVVEDYFTQNLKMVQYADTNSGF